jgi:sugar (pentulose or hexulose) kinase
MGDKRLFLGLDIGTSGARAVVIDEDGQPRAMAKAAMAEFGANPRAPLVWRAAAFHAVDLALAQVDPARIAALAVDGTSGTLLALDSAGAPLGDALMYDDRAADAGALGRIAAAAPATSAAHGPTGGLGKAFDLLARAPARIAHQADWIASLFSGRLVSDANNALKTGYDPVAGAWPDWIAGVGFPTRLLPDVLAPGAVVGTVTNAAARRFGFRSDAWVVAGTTDGCASFLATGAREDGDGVTALGSTLTIKQLSRRPIFAPQYGVYSHKILGLWLVGGASNSGGAALLAHFTAAEIEALTPRLTPESPTGLDYYPLSRPGERFPIADPAWPPRVNPRPDDSALFLQGLLEGIADIEALAYARLQELGAPRLACVRSVGGGARNPAWTQIRARRLGVPLLPAFQEEAAYGAALLARALD